MLFAWLRAGKSAKRSAMLATTRHRTLPWYCAELGAEVAPLLRPLVERLLLNETDFHEAAS
jgi:hypothetical protein